MNKTQTTALKAVIRQFTSEMESHSNQLVNKKAQLRIMADRLTEDACSANDVAAAAYDLAETRSKMHAAREARTVAYTALGFATTSYDGWVINVAGADSMVIARAAGGHCHNHEEALGDTTVPAEWSLKDADGRGTVYLLCQDCIDEGFRDGEFALID